MPWVHLHVDTSGLVKACCNANITFGDITDQTLEEIWHGEPIKKFRRSLLLGNRDRRCASCYQKEGAGKSSMRTETLEKFRHRMDWVAQTDALGHSEMSQPVYFDIRFNNLCNLRCRTCWHGASSSWFDEAKVLKNTVGKKAVIEASADSGAFIDELFDMPIEVEEIYFAGGEPLMMKEHYEILDRLIATGNKQVHLRYNTNLSVLRLRDRYVLPLWSQFEKVTVSASIDGLRGQAEYIRKGLKWCKFQEHMRTIRTELPHVQLEIAPTVSVFNILSLAALHRYFFEEGLIDVDAIYLNVLSRPDYYNIRVLPETLKLKVQTSITDHMTWLTDRGASQTLVSEFQSILIYLSQKEGKDKLLALQRHIRLLDEMRAECFAVTFPELARALDLA